MRGLKGHEWGLKNSAGLNWREELLRLPAVMQRVGLRKTAIYARMRLRQFPKPIAIGVRARAWRASDIDQWIADRTDESVKASTRG